MKKISTLGLFLIFLCITACKESREEKVAAEQSKGAVLVEDKAALVKGIGEALQGDGKKAAAEISTGVGKVISGVIQGIDRAKEINVVADQHALQLGVNTDRGVIEVATGETSNRLKVFVKSAHGFNGLLHIRGFDDDDREVGRSDKVESTLLADDAKYLAFSFDEATPINRVEKWILFASAKQQ